MVHALETALVQDFMNSSPIDEQHHQLRTADGAVITYLACRASGAQGTLVLLHGMASNMTRWSEFVQNTKLRQSWHLIRLDLRGHGQSIDRGKISLRRWGEDIAEILNAEALGKVVLVGHCMGANLAIDFAHHHQELTQGVVLIEPIFRHTLRGSLRRVSDLRPLVQGLASLSRLLASCGIYRRHLPQLDLQQLDAHTRALMAQYDQDFPSDRYGSVREDLRYVPFVVYLQDLLAVTAELPLDALNNIPVLAMLCTGTGFTDRDATLACLHRLSHCQIENVPAAHWIPTEQPVLMRELIEQWCQTLIADTHRP